MDFRAVTMEDMEAGLEHVLGSPRVEGLLRMIVRRPEIDAREVLTEAQLDPNEGLVGDSWKKRRSSRTSDGSPHPEMQLTLINARVLALLAQTTDRWPLAGDQLVVDLDLSVKNVPAGTKLALGTAIIEVTDQPHTGCKKFLSRYGEDALKFVSSPAGKELRMRGIYARVIQAGVVRTGDPIRKVG